MANEFQNRSNHARGGQGRPTNDRELQNRPRHENRDQHRPQGRDQGRDLGRNQGSQDRSQGFQGPQTRPEGQDRRPAMPNQQAAQGLRQDQAGHQAVREQDHNATRDRDRTPPNAQRAPGILLVFLTRRTTHYIREKPRRSPFDSRHRRF